MTPDPIPVYIGDDWSFAFTYRESGGNGAPVDLTGLSIVCDLFAPYASAPIELTAEAGQTGLIAAANGQFGIGVARALTSGLQTTTVAGATALNIGLVTDSLRRTIAVWPLLIFDKRTLLAPTLVNLETVDPIDGRTLHFDGSTALFPVAA